MSYTTISSGQFGFVFPTSFGSTFTMAIFCDSTFDDETGKIFPASPGDSLADEFVAKVSGTVAAGVGTYNSYSLPKTDLATPANVVRYYARIFNSRGAPTDYFPFSNRHLRSSLGNSINELAWANDNAQAPFRPQVDTKPNTDQMNMAINAVLYAPMSTNQLGLGKASVNPVDAASPILVGDNDPRVPTQNENDALVGTSGIPSSTNPFVTDDDRRVNAVYNVGNYGVVGAAHGSTPSDESTALLALLTLVHDAGGGTIQFNARAYRFDSSWLIPNDGAGTPSQPSLRITGQGASPNGQGGAPSGGTIIDLRYNSTLSKIDTRGLGLLEIDHITFKDGGAGSSVPFIQATNTTLHVHDCEFYGNTPTTPTQDAIVLGNTSTTVSGNFNAPFQGYGTVIENNYFNRIQRGVYGRTYCNAVVIQNNTWWTTCGGTAAVEFLPDISNSDTGNVIVGNLIELNSYTYGMKFNSQFINNNVGPNGFFDSGVGLTAIYRFESGAVFNRVEAGYHEDTETFVSDANASPSQLIITAHQSQVSQFPQPVTFRNAQTKIIGNDIGLITEDASGNQWLQAISPSSFGHPFDFFYLPSGGSLEAALEIYRQSSADKRLLIGGSGRSTLAASAADLYVQAASGQSLRLGTAAAESVLVLTAVNTTTALPVVSTLATGTSPFTVASTTKVTNLNADKVDGQDWADPGAIGGGTPGAGTFTVLVSTGGALNGTLGAGTPNTVAATTVDASGSIKSSGSTGVGYATGAGGTVAQTTDKSTTVIINKITGTITMDAAALNAGVIVSFQVTNSTCAATDVIVAQHDSGGTLGSYTITPNTPAGGSFRLAVRNNTAGNLSEAIVIRFAIIKSVVA